MLWFALEEVKKEGAIIRGKPGEQDHLSLVGSLLLALAQQMLTSIHAAASSLQYLENGSSVEAEGFHASRRVDCSYVPGENNFNFWDEPFELLPWTQKTLPKVEWGGDRALPSSSVCALLITPSAWTTCVLYVPFVYILTHCNSLQVFSKT